MKILLTGGMGFIGSHTAVVLQEAGHIPVLFDNLSNAAPSVVERIERITRHAPNSLKEISATARFLKRCSVKRRSTR